MNYDSSNFVIFNDLNVLEKHFYIVQRVGKNKILLKKDNSTNSVVIDFPFIYDHEISMLCGMMPGGSLTRDLMRIFFDQKKDKKKPVVFGKIIEKRFRPESKIHFRVGNHGTSQVYINSKTLSHFFYYILGLSKSDEDFKIPEFMFESSLETKRTFLRELFAMEGTVLKPDRHSEVRLHNTSKILMSQTKELLREFNIKCRIKARSDKPNVYRLFINGDNALRFAISIGSNYSLHSDRLKKLLKRRSESIAELGFEPRTFGSPRESYEPFAD